MKRIYGVTWVDTEGWMNGTESNTELFANRGEQLKCAYKWYKQAFEESEFSDGKDDNGEELLSEEDFKNEICSSPYVLIQRPDSHAQFELFIKEVA